jgi:DNA-binding response OmpR family regulator
MRTGRFGVSYLNCCAVKEAKVFTVSNIRDGTEAFIRVQPDFVFVDLHLPHGDSFELLARIRTLDAETSRKTPVIAMKLTQ